MCVINVLMCSNCEGGSCEVKPSCLSLRSYSFADHLPCVILCFEYSSKIPHPGTLPLEDELASPLGSPVARSGKGSSSSGKSGKLMALKDAAAMEDPSDLSEDIDTPVATAPATPRFRHKTRSNGDLTLLTTGVPAAAVAASTVAGLPAVLQSGASGGSTASSSANSTSTVSSTGAGGITLGGPPGMSSKQSGFANANYNSYANTSSGGGGEGHFSAVSTIRPKKQPPPQQTDNLFMVRTVFIYSYLCEIVDLHSQKSVDRL